MEVNHVIRYILALCSLIPDSRNWVCNHADQRYQEAIGEMGKTGKATATTTSHNLNMSKSTTTTSTTLTFGCQIKGPFSAMMLRPTTSEIQVKLIFQLRSWAMDYRIFLNKSRP